MKMHIILVITIVCSVLVLAQSQGWDNNCVYKDIASGQSYDFKGLQKSTYWRLKDKNGDSGLFSMDYLFNFCKPVSQQCKGQSVAAYEALEVLGQITDTCEILGKVENQKVELQNPSDPVQGVKITYTGGDTCQNSENPIENNRPRQVTFKLNCRDSENSNFEQTKINSVTVTKCNLEFVLNTPSGCPVGYLSGTKSTTILFWIIFIAACYFGFGTLYNQKFKGILGMESIPNLSFWKQIPGLIQDGMKFSFQKLRLLSGSVISSVSKMQKAQQDNNGQGYDTV